MFCVMFVICQLKFEHLKMRKPMELPINILCDARRLLAMPLVFSSSNAQILIDKSQTSHKTFIGNAIGFLIFKPMALQINVLCDVCDLSIKI
jgi:hypothetical protein